MPKKRCSTTMGLQKDFWCDNCVTAVDVESKNLRATCTGKLSVARLPAVSEEEDEDEDAGKKEEQPIKKRARTMTSFFAPDVNMRMQALGCRLSKGRELQMLNALLHQVCMPFHPTFQNKFHVLMLNLCVLCLF